MIDSSGEKDNNRQAGHLDNSPCVVWVVDPYQSYCIGLWENKR